MKINAANLAELILQVYAQIPSSKCKGKCQAFCGPVFMTETEYNAIPAELRKPYVSFTESIEGFASRERAFYANQPIPEPACGYLTQDGRCSIYEYRPLICRAWGANHSSQYKCPYGCEETISDDLLGTIMGCLLYIAANDSTRARIVNND